MEAVGYVVLSEIALFLMVEPPRERTSSEVASRDMTTHAEPRVSRLQLLLKGARAWVVDTLGHRCYREPHFYLLSLSIFVYCFGFMVSRPWGRYGHRAELSRHAQLPFFYAPQWSKEVLGVDDHFDGSSVPVILLNAGLAAGRLTLGHIADRIGETEMYFLITFCAGLSQCIQWHFVKSAATLRLFCFTYSFSGGESAAAARTGFSSQFGTGFR